MNFQPMNFPRRQDFVTMLLAASLICMAGCGSGSRSMNSVQPANVAGVEANAVTSPATDTPATEFTVAVKPTTVTIAPGKSGSAKVTTTITKGYDHSLDLSVSHVPTGVSVVLDPTVIPAPGDGTSNATISVSSGVAPGTYSLVVKATDGKNTSTATLTLKVSSSNPEAKFQGCWYKTGGHSYQGVTVSVGNPGTYPFNALLYYGATCTTYADQFGYGQEIPFGGFDYIFWFDHFPDRENMSALWSVGSDTSQCLVYDTSTPDCN